MDDPTGNGAGGCPSPPVTGTITRVTWMPRVPRSRRIAHGRTYCGRTHWGSDSRRTCSGRSIGHGRTVPRRSSGSGGSARDGRFRHRRPRGDWLRGDGRFRSRRPGSGTFRSSGTAGSGPSSALTTSRSSRKLTRGGRCGASAGQLRGTRLEPVGHRWFLSGTGADPALDLAAIDARAGPGARSRGARSGSTPGTCRRTLTRRRSTWSRRAC
jgi:hypothetical protein